MTPTGELQRAQQKSAHLSNKKKNKLRSKDIKYVIEKLQPGDIISYYVFYGPDAEKDVRFAIVIDVSNGKKKWLRKYKILTEHTLWETSHKSLEEDYRITKVG